jgi:hypothetical protein
VTPTANRNPSDGSSPSATDTAYATTPVATAITATAVEHGLVDRDGLHVVEAEVGADPVAGLEENHVVHDELVSTDVLHPPVAQHPRTGREEVRQPRGRPVGAVLLDESEDPVEDDDDCDGDG